MFTDLKFAMEIYPIRISILEKFRPGTVVRIWAWDNLTKYWRKLWSGPPQACQNQARIFTPPLEICKFKTNLIRLEFNYSLADYYTQINGVLLFGTEDLILPKRTKKNHRCINVLPNVSQEEKTQEKTKHKKKGTTKRKRNEKKDEAREKKTEVIHNLTEDIGSIDSFFSYIARVERILKKNYRIWYAKRNRPMVRYYICISILNFSGNFMRRIIQVCYPFKLKIKKHQKQSIKIEQNNEKKQSIKKEKPSTIYQYDNITTRNYPVRRLHCKSIEIVNPHKNTFLVLYFKFLCENAICEIWLLNFFFYCIFI